MNPTALLAPGERVIDAGVDAPLGTAPAEVCHSACNTVAAAAEPTARMLKLDLRAYAYAGTTQ